MRFTNFRDWTIGKKFSLAGSALIILSMGLFTLIITTYLSTRMEKKTLREFDDKVQLSVKMVDAYDTRLQKEAQMLATVFRSSFPDRYAVDSSRFVTMNGISVPLLQAGGTVLNQNYEPVDRFTRQTGATATIFVKKDDAFIRIATSVKKEDGSRAVGTTLDRTHPAYEPLMRGDIFTGKAVLFGKDYMTRYEPVMDASGKVVGVLYIGIDFTEGLAILKKDLRDIKIGDTGYIFIMDGEGKDAGQIIAHPSLEGENLSLRKDARGFAFFKEVLKNKEGSLTYYWNAGAGAKAGIGGENTQKKLLVYRYHKNWGWIIAASCSTRELMSDISHIRNGLILASILIAVFLSLCLIIMTRTIVTRPLVGVIAMLKELSKGHLNKRLQMERKDEIGVLALTLDNFAEKLQKDMVGTLARISAGDVSMEIKVVDDKDEITPALLGMVTTLRGLVAEMTMLTKAAADGKLDTRGYVDMFKGSYKDIVAGVNSTLDAVIGPLNVAAEYVDRISKGDIPPKITDTYKGDFNEIKNNLNACIEAISRLIEDANTVAYATVEGQLNVRADAARHQGEFRKVINGINDTLEALIGPLTRTIEHLEHLSMGVIDEQITREYKGDYSKIKISFNRGFAAISLLVNDMNMLSDAAVAGKLVTRADGVKHQGDFRKIVEGVNKTLDAVLLPVTDASRVLEKMASNDFTQYMVKEYAGDHSIIKNNINRVLDTMNESLRRVAESTNQVATTTQELSATAEQMASGSQEQTSQTAQVATSMEQMSATVQEVAKNSGLAANRAREAGDTARKGGEVVEQTVSGMQRIATSVRELQGVIQGLSGNSEKIGDIVGVIDDVADQTNLLALNAAIEAARAGEQGRGFAVVADEVRKLAERTSASTKEIAAMVKSIQGDTVKAVESMETSSKEVASGVSLASQAGESLKEIVAGAKGVEEMVQQIATAAEEQSAAAEEISSNVESIASVSKQNAEGAKQTAVASQELAHLTNGLQSVVDQFKIKK